MRIRTMRRQQQRARPVIGVLMVTGYAGLDAAAEAFAISPPEAAAPSR